MRKVPSRTDTVRKLLIFSFAIIIKKKDRKYQHLKGEHFQSGEIQR